MVITPDTKDWTWVLERPCPECGFDAAKVGFDDIPRLLRENAAGWRPVLERADVTVRPNDHTWSALEYAAHVRDVFRVFSVRLGLMRSENDPQFANWDQDATAVAERYNEQDPRWSAVSWPRPRHPSPTPSRPFRCRSACAPAAAATGPASP